MKTVVSISILLSFIFISMIGYGIFIGPKTVLKETITVQTPVPVVCKILRDFESYPHWSRMVLRKSDPNKPFHYQTEYHFENQTVWADEFVEPKTRLTTIRSKQLSDGKKSLIADIQNIIQVRALPDGSTSVEWEFSYSCLSLGAKLINPILTRSKIERAFKAHLQGLKQYLEN